MMLSAIGNKPVNTLEGSTSQRARIALNIYDSTDKQIQSQGWHFNTDPSYTLSVDASTGFIPVPENFLRFTAYGSPYIVIRGDKLYDKRTKTYIFDSAVTGSVLQFLEFEDTPEEHKAYVVASASVKMYERFVQDQAPTSLRQEELETRAIALDRDYEAGQHSVFDDPLLPDFLGSSHVQGAPRFNVTDFNDHTRN